MKRAKLQRFIHHLLELKKRFNVRHFHRFCSLKDPVLIVGCGRSGTSLLLSIMGAHPSFYACSEETGVFLHPPKFRWKWLDQYWRMLKFYTFFASKEEIPSSARRWVEKTPRHVRFLDRVFSLYGDRVKVLHIVRDGRDVVTSKLPGKDEFHVPIDRWINDVSIAYKYEGDPRFKTIRYEDLVNDPETVIKSMMEWLGETYHDNQKDFHLTSTVKFHGAFYGGHVHTLYKDSINKWKNDKNKYDRAKALMDDDMGVLFLKRYGYIHE